MFNFRTDLASERKEIYQKANNLKEIEGIETEKEEIDENIKVERVKITNENGEKAIGKPIGSYITIDIKKLKIAQDEDIEKAANVLTKELKNVIDKHIGSQDQILVVGLGNIYVTPDALRAKSNKRNRSNKTYNQIFTAICRRRNKDGKCNFTGSFRYNWN